jgi:hypothetical protein
MMVLTLGACRQESPIVRMCVATVGGTEAAPAEKFCRCFDGLARKQLDAATYAELDAAAGRLLSAHKGAGVSHAMKAGERMTRFVAGLSTPEQGITAIDTALLLAKTAQRCS